MKIDRLFKKLKQKRNRFFLRIHRANDREREQVWTCSVVPAATTANVCQCSKQDLFLSLIAAALGIDFYFACRTLWILYGSTCTFGI